MRDAASGAAGLVLGALSLAGVVVGLAAPPGTAQSGPPGCVGETDAAEVPRHPGPLVRFGINARAVTGQIGPTPAPAVPGIRPGIWRSWGSCAVRTRRSRSG
jgi:hypothetical protein